MRLIKLIAPTALIAAVALFAPHAGAQTMGEYATTTAGVGTGAGSMGTSIGNAVSSDDLGGGSSTWGASSLGASFDERAGAAAGLARVRISRRARARRLKDRRRKHAGRQPHHLMAILQEGSPITTGSRIRIGSPERNVDASEIAFRPGYWIRIAAVWTSITARRRDWTTATVRPRDWTTAAFRTDALADRLALRRDIPARALLARGRPHVVNLVRSLERSRTFRQSHPRQLAPREDMNVGHNSVRMVERPRANE